jgi:GNAT superfamily N-acetyltransferase
VTSAVPSEREVLLDEAGRPAAEYVPGQSHERPWADALRTTGGHPGSTVPLLLDRLPGWTVTTDENLGADLLLAGACSVRYAHHYRWDLGLRRPIPDWGAPTLPALLRLVAASTMSAQDLVATRQAAYGPGHPDHGADRATGSVGRLRGLLDGTRYGGLLDCSAVVLEGMRVVAAVTVNRHDGTPSRRGPWFTDLFRDPLPRYTGLGTVLMQWALAHAAEAGETDVGLSVTEGNPARLLFERIGFFHTESTRTVVLPQDRPGLV